MPENKLPSYEKLFGNLDYSSADEYRSVLSPAAYLTDIMDLKNWKYGDEVDAVDDRRDDISEILLNVENTITEIPHLDVVNQIMENRVARNNAGADPYATLKIAKYPFNLPFNFDKTEIKNILEYFKTDPHQFYKAFIATPVAEIEAREYLGLSAEEYQLITTPQSGDALKEYYGLNSQETFEELSSVPRFRKAAELSALQVTELIYQNLSDSEKTGGLAKTFFINGASSVSTYLVIETDPVTNEERLLVGTLLADGTISGGVLPATGYFDRIHRFIRLSRKIGLSVADLDLVLVKACNRKLDQNAVQILAVVKWLKNTYEIEVEEICTFISAIKDYGKGDKTIPDDLFDRLFNNGYDKKINELDASSVVFKNRVQACLGCNEFEYNAIEEYLAGAGKIIEATPSRLALAYRIKKLATLIDIPVTSLFTLFDLIDNNYLLLEQAKFPLPISFQQTIDNCREIISVEDMAGSVTTDFIHNILWLVQVSAVLMQWLNDNEMTVEQLEFICTEHSSGTVEGVLSSEETDDLFRDLDGQFRPVLFKVESLLSGITDKLTADILYENLSNLESGVCTGRGVIRSTTTAAALLPLYRVAIREKLSIAVDDLTKTGLSADVLDELFRIMQNKDYIDLDEYISNTDANIEFFSDSANAEIFLQEADPASAAIIFKEVSERAKSYFRANEAAMSECSAIAEKIFVQGRRQQSVLFGVLEGGLNIASDIVKILCTALFRTADESEQMATVRFMTPLMEAFDRETVTGKLVFDASLVTSFRRLQQFSILVSKTDLKARELEVLFFVEEIQNSLPEKLKLPAPFTEKIDSMYSDAESNIYVFSGERYLRFSGLDYSLEATGTISGLPEIPSGFHSGINAAIRDWAPEEEDRKTYFFSGDSFANAASPNNVEAVATYWGKVRNNYSGPQFSDSELRW